MCPEDLTSSSLKGRRPHCSTLYTDTENILVKWKKMPLLFWTSDDACQALRVMGRAFYEIVKSRRLALVISPWFLASEYPELLLDGLRPYAEGNLNT